MVGVPRSKGCQTCVSRRIKCDETRPACNKCQKYGVVCPGYEKEIKFVSEKHRIRQRGKGNLHEDEDRRLWLASRKKASSSSSSGSRSSASTTPSDLLSPDSLSPKPLSPSSGSAPGWVDSSYSLTPRSRCLSQPILAAPSPDKAQYIGTMVQQLKYNMGQYDIGNILYWMQLDKIGVNPGLDGAMCSLVMQLLGKEMEDDDMLVNSRTLYGQSLMALQSALYHPKAWKYSETLCSAILLCNFELFAGTTSADTWLKHARGVGILMEKRGAAAHADGWDAAMALSFRGTLIMSDLFHPTSDHCFLARPDWSRVMRDGGRYLVHPPHVSNGAVKVADDYFYQLAKVPEILLKAFALRDKLESGAQPDPETVQPLINLATASYDALTEWRERCIVEIPETVPEESISDDPESPHLFVYTYRSTWAGSLSMSYWASMLIIQETLLQCQWPGEELRNSQVELVSCILRSIEFVGQGTLGPYRVGYPVRIVYEFSSAESQQWIRKVLVRFNKKYAATDKNTYPPPREDGNGYS